MTALNPLPSIGVLPVREMRGMTDLSEVDIDRLTVKTFDDAFKERWQTDAHFCTYQPTTYHPTDPNLDQDWPRCNKILLPKLRAAGVELNATMLVVEYDNPGQHGAWNMSPVPLATFLEQLDMLAVDWPTAWQWSLFYTTRNGARFVYVLDKPVPVDEAEQHHQWLCQQFHQRGIKVDLTVSDWTRIFRLPWVVRGGVPTWAEVDPPMEFIRQYDNRLEVATLGKAVPTYTRKQDTIAAPIERLDLPKPDYDEAKALIEVITDRGFAPTTWTTLARRRLKGRDCFDALFNGVSLAEHGKRDDTLQKYIGQVVGLLSNVEGTTAVHVYGLFVDAVMALEPDSGTPDWTTTLWDKICRVWSQETAKAAGIILQTEHNEQAAQAMFRTMARGMRAWCDSPILERVDSEDQADINAVQEWVERRIIASTPRGFSLLLPNGYYEPIELNRTQLIMRWRMLGLDMIKPSRIPKDNGRGFRDVTPESLLNAHGIVCTKVVGKVCIEGGIIEGMDSKSPIFVVPLYRRNLALEAQACFNQHVDTWLRTMFGERYIEVEQWIQWALAFEEGPIAALSINGAPSSGKKLLVQGLAECLEVPALADAEDIVGDYSYGLLETPFLVVNEGWPAMARGTSPADKFRHFVGGDPIRVQRKYMSPVEIRNPMRVILTANNMNLIQGLTGNRDLSPSDREALFLRILHFNIGGDAADWLRARGGMEFTGCPGNRWIAGDSGQDSDHVLAKHFLWLYQRRTNPPAGSDRLLVQGGNNPEIMFDMRTQSGRSPIVIETILRMLDSLQPNVGVAIEDGKVYVTTYAVLDYFRQRVSQTAQGERINMANITSVLKGLIVEEPPTGGTVLASKKELGRRRWHELDVELLMSVALRDGHVCKKLDMLYRQRANAKIQQDILDDSRLRSTVK